MAHQLGVDDGHRSARDRRFVLRRARGDLAAGAERSHATADPAAGGDLLRRPRRAPGQLPATLRLRENRRDVAVRRCGIRGAERGLRRCRAPPREQHAIGNCRRACVRPTDAAAQRDRMDRAVMERRGRVRRPRRDQGVRAAPRHRAVLAGLVEPRRRPRPPVAALHRTERARTQRLELRTDRRHHGGPHDVATGDSRWRAELGLPLHLDPRQRLHAAGIARPGLRMGSLRVLRVPARDAGGRRVRRPMEPADHVRHRR